jgi:hypothetical protein
VPPYSAPTATAWSPADRKVSSDVEIAAIPEANGWPASADSSAATAAAKASLVGLSIRV